MHGRTVQLAIALSLLAAAGLADEHPRDERPGSFALDRASFGASDEHGVAPISVERRRLSPADGENSGKIFDRGACEASDTVLCLLGNRFQVEAVATAADGTAGAARITTVSDSTGLLRLFGPRNVEVLVKMLDACGVHGRPAFWVSTAATTDSEVTLSITDTATGRSQDYFSPRGEVGPNTIDVTTFNDCS